MKTKQSVKRKVRKPLQFHWSAEQQEKFFAIHNWKTHFRLSAHFNTNGLETFKEQLVEVGLAIPSDLNPSQPNLAAKFQQFGVSWSADFTPGFDGELLPRHAKSFQPKAHVYWTVSGWEFAKRLIQAGSLTPVDFNYPGRLPHALPGQPLISSFLGE